MIINEPFWVDLGRRICGRINDDNDINFEDDQSVPTFMSRVLDALEIDLVTSS